MIGVECQKTVAVARGVASWVASMNVCTGPPVRLPSGRSQFTRRPRRGQFDVPRKEISPTRQFCSPGLSLASVRQHTWILGTGASPVHKRRPNTHQSGGPSPSSTRREAATRPTLAATCSSCSAASPDAAVLPQRLPPCTMRCPMAVVAGMPGSARRLPRRVLASAWSDVAVISVRFDPPWHA